MGAVAVFSINTGKLAHPLGSVGSQNKSVQYIAFALHNIVSASQNGCWNIHEQQCEINEGERIGISISIADSVGSLGWARTQKERRETSKLILLFL